MKVHQFLDHYGLTENPFAQEDAQADQLFRDHCLTGTHHPAWDKIYGNPQSPATSIVFGEQGSGKTALRMQMIHHLNEHNRQHPNERAFIVEYDDFNPFLDCFRERLHGRHRKPEKAVQNWRLWDHMDAILTLATTKLCDRIIAAGKTGASRTTGDAGSVAREKLDELTRLEKRDVLMLAAFYDHNRDLSAGKRWAKVRKALGYSTIVTWWDVALGFAGTATVVALILTLSEWRTLFTWWVPLAIIAFWLPWLLHQLSISWKAWRSQKQVRVIDHQFGPLRRILSSFPRHELGGQPIPSTARGDDRYELFHKLQAVLRTLGFTSMIVLVDRVDEPHLINGSAERMRDLLWPMFDNKFLKHPGIAFKMLLPAAVVHYLNRQEKEFYERSRLDKQNLISGLDWSGQALFDITNDRIKAVAKLAEGEPPTIKDFFDEAITREELISTFSRLRVPRHLFKFIYRVLVDHCSKFTEDQPDWTISRETMQSSLALFLRDLDAYDQGRGAG